MNYLALRRQTLLKSLKKDGPDAVLVTAAVNVTYLTGFTGDSSYYVSVGKTAVLVTDHRFEQQAKDDCPELGQAGGLELHVRPHDRTTLEAAVEVLAKGGARAVAVEAGRLTVADLEALRGLAPKLTFVPVKDLVEAMRAVKDMSEVEHIRASIKVAERAYKMFVATLSAAASEKGEVDAAARQVIADAGFGDYFTHGLGHGIGLEVHEAPRLRANSDDVLEAGMVITVEPAVYIPGEKDGQPGWGGVRIEDDVLVTRDGCTVLSTLPRDLSALAAAG